MMTASIGARQWWRWCQSTHPMPGNNPTAVDLSWPSLSSSIPLLLSAPALSLSLSLATALARTTLFVEHLLQSCYFFHFYSHYLVPLSISFCHSALALNRRTPLLVSNSFCLLHVLGWLLSVSWDDNLMSFLLGCPFGFFGVWGARSKLKKGFLVFSVSVHQASSLGCLTLCMASFSSCSLCCLLTSPLYNLSICAGLEWLNEG